MPSINTPTELLTGAVHRRLSGLEFRLKSEPLETLFRFLSNGNVTRGTASSPWGNLNHYLLEFADNGIPRALPGFQHGRFDLWGERELILSRTPKFNLSILTAVGLGSEEGIRLLVPTVITPNSLQTYLDGLHAAVRQLYIDCLKESTVNIRITTEQF